MTITSRVRKGTLTVKMAKGERILYKLGRSYQERSDDFWKVMMWWGFSHKLRTRVLMHPHT